MPPVSIIPTLIVGKSKSHGQGVFAGRHFNSGDVILEFSGLLYEFNDINDDVELMYLQVAKGVYIGPTSEKWDANDDLVNHSCDPNAAVIIGNGKVVLKAIRPINPMMEIAYDYSITLRNDPWSMTCHCGTKKCRGTIREYKFLPADVKQSYEWMKIVPAYVLEV